MGFFNAIILLLQTLLPLFSTWYILVNSTVSLLGEGNFSSSSTNYLEYIIGLNRVSGWKGCLWAGHCLLHIRAIIYHYAHYSTKDLFAFDILPFKVTPFWLYVEG